MAQVFVVNGTMQNQHFLYRVIESQTLRRLEIPAGRQQKFPEDFNEQQLVSVISQLERFGAVPCSDIKAMTSPRTLVYSVDRKISEDRCNEARDIDTKIRQEISGDQTEKAGLAQFATIEAGGNKGSVKATSLEVTQLSDVGDDPVKGGVDVEVNVSSKAGKKTTGKRTG